MSMVRQRIREIFADDRNADPMRLAILGFSEIEEQLNDGLAFLCTNALGDAFRYVI